LKTVTEKPKGHKDEIKAILAALEIPDNDPVAKAWLSLAGQDNDYGLHARAHRDALSTPQIIRLPSSTSSGMIFKMLSIESWNNLKIAIQLGTSNWMRLRRKMRRLQRILISFEPLSKTISWRWEISLIS